MSILSAAPMPSSLHAEFEYYLAHQDELVRQYEGRVIAVKDRTVLGDYATEQEAIAETAKRHPIGTFLVQRVEKGTDAYTQTFYSRVRVGS